ncbi:MAG TPA: hypothetical protein VHY84_26195, partial [Bryobacteraceae bacterium]|nr:hypothetical protein [Bryobacteraceae bacterium]
AHQVVKALVPRAILLGSHTTEANLSILKELVRRMAVKPGTRSIVLVSPRSFLRADRHDEATELMDRALRAGVVINSFSTQGVTAIIPGGTAEAPPGLQIDVKQEFERKRAYADEGIMQNYERVQILCRPGVESFRKRYVRRQALGKAWKHTMALEGSGCERCP